MNKPDMSNRGSRMNIKLIVAIILLALVVVFVVQNVTTVELHFLFWTVSMSRSLMAIFLLIIGFAVGWLSGTHYSNTRQKVKK
jgi:uncharacterized integral membrane protein